MDRVCLKAVAVQLGEAEKHLRVWTMQDGWLDALHHTPTDAERALGGGSR